MLILIRIWKADGFLEFDEFCLLAEQLECDFGKEAKEVRRRIRARVRVTLTKRPPSDLLFHHTAFALEPNHDPNHEP